MMLMLKIQLAFLLFISFQHLKEKKGAQRVFDFTHKEEKERKIGEKEDLS